MEIIQTRAFRNVVKKLHKNQKQILDKAVLSIVDDPNIGEVKVGDLSNIYVYKFNMHSQLMLLAYKYTAVELTLIYLSIHENFYRDLKQIIKNTNDE